MKRLSLALLLSPAAALAHEGDHSQLAPAQAVEHALSSADHLMVLAAVLAIALAFRPVRRALARVLRLAK
jgi:hydrogenase/urease accessory protein HupE